MAVTSDLLTPVITVKTNVPLPKLTGPPGADGHPTEEPSKDENVMLKICSEFVDYSATVNNFDSAGKLVLVSDARGNPMIFATNTKSHLNLGLHVDGANQGFQLYPLLPGGQAGPISAFDVLKDEVDQKLHIAASVKVEGIYIVYHASFEIPELSFDSGSRKVSGFNPEKDLTWTPVTNNLGPKTVSSLSCGLVNQSPNSPDGSANFQIIAGTEESEDIQGAHYRIDPTPRKKDPWKLIENFEEAKKIIDLQPLTFSTGQGIFTLYSMGGRTHCVATTIDPKTQHEVHHRVLLNELGKAHSLFSSVNPWG
jgi:hypothetical protein